MSSSSYEEDIIGSYSQRISEKKKFELDKILLMQDEEIKRLKLERLNLQKQIQSNEKHYFNVDKFYKRKIVELRNQLNEVQSKKTIQLFNLKKEHSYQIRFMQHEHQAELTKVHIYYQQKLHDNVENQPKKEELQRDKSAELFEKSLFHYQKVAGHMSKHTKEKREAVIQDKLLEYKSIILNYKSRGDLLEQQIADAKKALEEEKAQYQIKINEAKEEAKKKASKTIKVADKSDDLILMQRANNIAALNDLRNREADYIDKLRAEINEKKKSNFIITNKIQDAKFGDLEDTKRSQEAVNFLVQEFELLQKSPYNSKIIRYTQKERDIKHYAINLKKRLEKSKEERDNLILENQKLSELIRKVDYKLYGRHGIHQIPIRKTKRDPFKDYGIFAK